MSISEIHRSLTSGSARRALLIGREAARCGEQLERLQVPWQRCGPAEAARHILRSRLQAEPVTCVIVELPPDDPELEAVLRDPVVGSLPIVLLQDQAWQLYSPHPVTPAILDALMKWEEPRKRDVEAPGLHVLVVDDVAVNRKFLEGYLGQLGHRSTLASGPAEAFELLMSQRFDAVLMDVEMPEENGPSLVARLRRAEGPNQETPVLAVTGHSGEAEATLCLQSGMDDVLVKPVNRDKLVEKLALWGGRRVVHGWARGGEVSDKPVELENLLAVTEGNAKLLGELIGLFSQDVTNCLKTMQQALAEDDEQGFLSCVHALRGAASYLGARQLEQLACPLEFGPQTPWSVQADDQLARLRGEFRRVETFLKTGLAKGDMVEVEFQTRLQLDAQQLAMLDLHSFLNIFNVALSELYFLGADLGRPEGFQQSAAVLEEFSRQLRQVDRLQETLQSSSPRLEAFWHAFESALDPTDDPARVEVSRDNLASIMAVLRQRVSQLLERISSPNLWVEMSLKDLQEDYTAMFAAVAKNSKGRYNIVYNVAAQRQQDYLIHLDFSSVDGETIRMPAVLQDVFRDLTANARKYTDPGGTIQAGLMDDGEQLRLVVEDSGRGIPAHEVSRVVELGYRASNVADKPTMGSGIGLTKAYWVAQRLGGSMRIRSGRGQGTRVTLTVPSGAQNRATGN